MNEIDQSYDLIIYWNSNIERLQQINFYEIEF